MNNQIHNRETRIHFKLASAIATKQLASLIEREIIRDGFDILNTETSLGADSVGENGQILLRGASLQDVIPKHPELASYASARYIDRESDLKIRVLLGTSEGEPFDEGSKMDFFTLIPNCRMDRNMLPSIVSLIPDGDQLQSALRNPKRIYGFTKRLCRVVDAERCIGVDSKNYTSSYFDDPAAFFFSRSEPIIPSELLEESD